MKRPAGNTCRNNIRALGTALFIVAGRNGSYPGYMNVLQLQNGKPFQNPITQQLTPVSWAVHDSAGNRPQADLRSMDERLARRRQASGGGGGGGGPSGGGTFVSTKFYTDQYIDQFLCPSDFQQAKTGTPISFVVNTGQQDLPTGDTPRAAAEAAEAVAAAAAAAAAPSACRATGVPAACFSTTTANTTSSRRRTTNRAPMVYMSDEKVPDPKDKTILLTENLDAQNYVFNSTSGGTTFQYAEVEVGSIWAPGTVDQSQTAAAHEPDYFRAAAAAAAVVEAAAVAVVAAVVAEAAVEPRGDDTLRINNSGGKGDGISYAYCRPSSRHPQTVNVAFVGTNVAALRDNISYFVYAKMMASDDENLKIPGTNTLMDAALRQYPLSDADVNP